MTSSKDSSLSAWACVCRVFARAAATSSDGAALARSKRSTVAFFSFTSIRSEETCDSNVCTLDDSSAFASLVYLAPSSTFASASSNSLILPLNSASVAANFSLSSIRTFLIARASKCAFCLSSSMASSPASPSAFPPRARSSSAFNVSISAVISVHAADARCRTSSFSRLTASSSPRTLSYSFAIRRISPFSAACARSNEFACSLASRSASRASPSSPTPLNDASTSILPPADVCRAFDRALVVSTALETFDLAA